MRVPFGKPRPDRGLANATVSRRCRSAAREGPRREWRCTRRSVDQRQRAVNAPRGVDALPFPVALSRRPWPQPGATAGRRIALRCRPFGMQRPGPCRIGLHTPDGPNYCLFPPL